MSTLKIGRSHKARKALFTRAIRRGFLTIGEIDDDHLDVVGGVEGEAHTGNRRRQP